MMHKLPHKFAQKFTKIKAKTISNSLLGPQVGPKWSTSDHIVLMCESKDDDDVTMTMIHVGRRGGEERRMTRDYDNALTMSEVIIPCDGTDSLMKRKI